MSDKEKIEKIRELCKDRDIHWQELEDILSPPKPKIRLEKGRDYSSGEDAILIRFGPPDNRVWYVRPLSDAKDAIDGLAKRFTAIGVEVEVLS